MSNNYQIFLSAVSPEFESARDEVANGLQAKGLEVKVQRSFRQENDAATTLEKLHNYIRDCDAVICIVGRYSGSYPPDEADFLPKQMLPEELDCAGYTQWEFHFARHYKKRLYIYFADGDWQPDKPPGAADDPAHQQAFVQHIKKLNLDRTHFNSTHQLCAEVFKVDWPHFIAHKPNNLPFASLGPLFKGREQFLEDLDKALSDSEGTAAITTKAQAVHGMGGVGKTRAAVEFAWRYASSSPPPYQGGA